MKRKEMDYSNEQVTKKARLDFPLVSATSLKNYILDDSLVDWLDLYHPNNKKEDHFSTFLKAKGLEFEEKVISFINTNKVPVVTISKDGKFSFEGVEET